MISFGHNDKGIHKALYSQQVMANIMTPTPAQCNFWGRIAIGTGLYFIQVHACIIVRLY